MFYYSFFTRQVIKHDFIDQKGEAYSHTHIYIYVYLQITYIYMN